MALADRLELFPALAAVGSESSPAHYTDVAVKASLKPRYTKELLALLACSEIIEVTPDGDHFFIPDSFLEVLAPKNIKDKAVSFCSIVPLFASVFDSIAEVYRKDGPLGMDYVNYGNFY